jgi:hypothetical protein
LHQVSVHGAPKLRAHLVSIATHSGDKATPFFSALVRFSFAFSPGM